MCFWAAHSFQELLLGLRGCLQRSHMKLLHLWTVHSAEQKKSLSASVHTHWSKSVPRDINSHTLSGLCMHAYMDAKCVLRQPMSWQQQKSPEARGVGCGQVLLGCAWERFEGLGEHHRSSLWCWLRQQGPDSISPRYCSSQGQNQGKCKIWSGA